MRIFIAGTGFTGSRIAAGLRRAGHEVWGLCRSGRCPEAVGVSMIAGDVLKKGGLTGLSALPEMDAVVSALSGSGLKDPYVYRDLYVEGPSRVMDALNWHGERRVWLLGSTGVYGVEDGAWVDEQTPAEPLHDKGWVQLEAEARLRETADVCSVLRLSGLYGPGRWRLIRQALRRRPLFKPDLWSNQIHADDVAHVLVQLAAGELWPELLLVSDNAPAKREEVFNWVREIAGWPQGCLDEDHPHARAQNRGNKRISNQMLRQLGVSLTYPDFRAGLAPLIPEALADLGLTAGS